MKIANGVQYQTTSMKWSDFGTIFEILVNFLKIPYKIHLKLKTDDMTHDVGCQNSDFTGMAVA